MFEQLTESQYEALRYIQSGEVEGRKEARYVREIINQYGDEGMRYRGDPLVKYDYVEKLAPRESNQFIYVITPKGREYLARERKRIDNERQSAEERKRERKYANHKNNVSLAFSATALLISFFANLDKVIASVQMIARWTLSFFQ